MEELRNVGVVFLEALPSVCSGDPAVRGLNTAPPVII